jgi:hypothetical protein
MNDGSTQYSTATDAELSSSLRAIDIDKYPQNTRYLLLEIERRWLKTMDKALQKSTDEALAEGASFRELDATSARRFFWPYFGYSVLLSLGLTVVGLALSVILSMTVGIFASVVGQDEAFIRKFAEYAYPIAMLILAVPFAKYFIGRITHRSFGGFALRIMHSEKQASSNKSLQPIAPKDGAPVER